MEAIKAVPLQIGTATGPAALTKTSARAAIAMTTPGDDEDPTSGKQGCPERRAEEADEKQTRRTKGASRSRDRRD